MSISKSSGKRKASANEDSQSIKRQKKKQVLANELPWREVKRPVEAGLDEFEGMLMLEEVDGVVDEIVW